MPGTGFVGVKGMNTRSFRDGGSRRVALPDPGIDVTDTETALRRRGRGVLAQRPERRLMLAILEDAVHVLTKYGPDPQGRFPSPQGCKLWHEARAWIADPRGDWPFAFEPLCETLGFDPEATRGAIARKVPGLAQVGDHGGDDCGPLAA